MYNMYMYVCTVVMHMAYSHQFLTLRALTSPPLTQRPHPERKRKYEVRPEWGVVWGVALSHHIPPDCRSSGYRLLLQSQ